MPSSVPRGGRRTRRDRAGGDAAGDRRRARCRSRARAQDVVRIDPLVITATRIEERAFDLPVAIDSIGAARIQQGQLQINLSESLVARSGPGRAEPMELRAGPAGFARAASARARASACAAYGSTRTAFRRRCPTGRARRAASASPPRSASKSCAARSRRCTAMPSGGVISIFTEDGPPTPTAQAQVVGGSYGTWNAIAKFGGEERRRQLLGRRQSLRHRRLPRPQRSARAIRSMRSSSSRSATAPGSR